MLTFFSPPIKVYDGFEQTADYFMYNECQWIK